MITETLYLKRDNTIGLVLRSRAATATDSTAEDLSGVTRMQLLVGDTVVDSASSAEAFDWSTDGANGVVTLDIGFEKGLKTGLYRARLTLYDNTYPNGLVWGFFMLDIKEG
jgi:hypothetical protein